MTAKSKVVALSGGIGGAKLALGFSRVLAAGELTVIVNTGDDFEHFGLSVSPDIDTLLYTLAGINNPDAGWGRAEETWSFMSAIGEIGGDTWFKLGDKDLALNVYRTHALGSGKTLSAITAEVSKRLGISSRIVPMSDDSVRTIVNTELGALEFQDYFVRRKCEPAVVDIRFCGSEKARPSSEFQQMLNSNDVAAFVVCPSNPYLSIDPILALAGVRESLINNEAPVIAVSPIIAGDSVKGPTAKIMSELGLECSATEIAQHYHGLIDGFVVDAGDANIVPEIEKLGIAVLSTNIIMKTIEDRQMLAEKVMKFVTTLRREK